MRKRAKNKNDKQRQKKIKKHENMEEIEISRILKKNTNPKY